jgi:Fur family transcriptional regulator, stress-responsive regulator
MPERLRDVGLRVTAARLAVLDAIPPGSHLDADQVATKVRDRLGRVSTQAVYDVLRALTDAGLLRRVEIPGSPAARYERWLHDNHHHLVCRSCGTVSDVACATGDAPCLVPTDSAGYAVDEAEVIYWGLCPSCRTGEGTTLRP